MRASQAYEWRLLWVLWTHETGKMCGVKQNGATLARVNNWLTKAVEVEWQDFSRWTSTAPHRSLHIWMAWSASCAHPVVVPIR